MNQDVLALPFDQYQRYRLVSDLLRQLRGSGPKLSVLDVGGRTAVLRSFATDADVTLVDMEASGEPGLVLGDGSRLPFKDRSFDAVCAFDTLEHVPVQHRRAFVAECRRVARRWVVLAGPYQHPRVVEAEELLQRFLEQKLGERHRYLDEHRHNGLPVRSEVEAQLRSLGGEVASIGHANLDRWLVLQCMSMYLDYDPALRPLARDFQRFYNAELYASDHEEPVYRHAIVAAFEGAPAAKLDGLLAPPRAPEGALRQVFDLAAEMVHFDRERERFREARAEFDHATREMRADLEGHERTIDELRRTNAEHEHGFAQLEQTLAGEREGQRKALEEVQADLEGHRRTLADLTRARADDNAAFEREREALRNDLEGHRKALADVRADLEGHRATVANQRAELERAQAEHAAESARLRSEVERERARAAEIEAALRRSDEEIQKALGVAQGLEQSLAQRELVYDQLRADLRSRWRNFLRVIRPPR